VTQISNETNQATNIEAKTRGENQKNDSDVDEKTTKGTITA
jgi:hypothetical protein